MGTIMMVMLSMKILLRFITMKKMNRQDNKEEQTLNILVADIPVAIDMIWSDVLRKKGELIENNLENSKRNVHQPTKYSKPNVGPHKIIGNHGNKVKIKRYFQ